jgi:hypothetical protein
MVLKDSLQVNRQPGSAAQFKIDNGKEIYEVTLKRVNINELD